MLCDAETVLAFGSPGGDFQDQWGLLFLLAVVDHKLGLQEANNSPAFHTGHLIGSFDPRPFEPGIVYVEERVAAATRRALARCSHRVIPSGPWSLEWLCAVGRDLDRELLVGAANPHDGQGFATGR